MPAPLPMTSSPPSTKRARLLYVLIAIALPCALVAWANANETRNLFYAYGAYIVDAGWLSFLAYRQGFVLSNPEVIGGQFFASHAAVVYIISGLASRLVPLGRVDWFWVFQGILCAPLGAAVGFLVPATDRPRRVTGMLLVAMAGTVFAFSGIALAIMGYIHFELLIGSGLCLMLAGIATGRAAVAWTGLGLAIITREDGGFHGALFLFAVLACDRLGRPFPLPRKTIIALTIAAVGGSVALLALQRLAFAEGATHLFEREYLGTPPFAHLTSALVRARLHRLTNESLFLLFPVAASVVIAIARRDPRYLLGWLVTLPWALLNFFGVSIHKAALGLYLGFPFLPAMFWVGAYDLARSSAPRAVAGSIARLTAVALASTLGMWVTSAGYVRSQLESMLGPVNVDIAAVERLARALHDDPSRSGRWLLDPSVASLELESFDRPRQRELDERGKHEGYDGLLFFWPTLFSEQVFPLLIDGGFTDCYRLPRTAVRFCGRPGAAPPADFAPASFFLDQLRPHDGRRDGDAFESPATERTDSLAFFGPLVPLEAGRYRASLEVARHDCPATRDPSVRVEAFRWATQESFAKGEIAGGESSVELDFTVTHIPTKEASELRLYAGPCPYTVKRVSIRTLWP